MLVTPIRSERLYIYHHPFSTSTMTCSRYGAQGWDKQPTPLLLLPTGVQDFVLLVHPGYAGPTPPRSLFKLPTYDSFVGPPSGWGVHHGLVLRACEIVAGNTRGIVSPVTFDQLLNRCQGTWEMSFRQECADRS